MNRISLGILALAASAVLSAPAFAAAEPGSAAARGAPKGPPPNMIPASSPEAQDLMQGYFGNTRICREDGLFECHMWLNADGSYVLFGYTDPKTGDPRAGLHVFRGTWTISGTKGAYKLCRKQEDEDRVGCGEEPERPDMNGERQHVGDSFWKFHDTGGFKGHTEHYYIVKGHV